MKIALATNDRKTLAERTGRAKEFVIYHYEESKLKSTCYITNSHDHHHHGEGESHEHSHPEITEALQGVDVFIVRRVGKNLKSDLLKAGINFEVSKEDDILIILKNYTTWE